MQRTRVAVLHWLRGARVIEVQLHFVNRGGVVERVRVVQRGIAVFILVEEVRADVRAGGRDEPELKKVAQNGGIVFVDAGGKKVAAPKAVKGGRQLQVEQGLSNGRQVVQHDSPVHDSPERFGQRIRFVFRNIFDFQFYDIFC